MARDSSSSSSRSSNSNASLLLHGFRITAATPKDDHMYAPKTSTHLTRSTLAIAAAAASLAALRPASAQLVDINAWRQSNEYRAMAMQRELAADMPQNQSLMLGSHNSFNSSGYPAGYPIPQHSYTITEQLDLGLRQIDLDIHQIAGYPNNLFVSHAVCSGIGWVAGDMDLLTALFEIRLWLDANPSEVIFIHTEQHFFSPDPSSFHAIALQMFEIVFGTLSGNDRLIRPSEFANNASTQLALLPRMTLNQLRSYGRVLVTNVGGANSPCDDHYIHDYPSQNVIFANSPGTVACSPEPSAGERRFWYFVKARQFAHNPGTDDLNENDIPDLVEINLWRAQPLQHPHSPDVNDNNVIDFYEQQYWDIQCIGARASECSILSNFYSFLYNNTSCGEYQYYGSENPQVTREAVRAGMDVIRFDPLGTSAAACGINHSQPADEHMRATIWSWDYRYLPPVDGMPRVAIAVIEGDTARIRWEFPGSSMRYALLDSLGEWAISSTAGDFAQAPPETSGALNFRVPGNGFEMQNLFGAMVRAGVTKVWINYHDLNADGAWTATTQPRSFYYTINNTDYLAPRAATSAVPALVSNSAQIAGVLALPTPPTGLVMGAYPGLFPATPSAPIRLNRPMTIVPAAHGAPAAIGR